MPLATSPISSEILPRPPNSSTAMTRTMRMCQILRPPMMFSFAHPLIVLPSTLFPSPSSMVKPRTALESKDQQPTSVAGELEGRAKPFGGSSHQDLSLATEHLRQLRKALLHGFSGSGPAPPRNVEQDACRRHPQRILRKFSDGRRRQRKSEPRGQPEPHRVRAILCIQKIVHRKSRWKILVAGIAVEDRGCDQ